MRMIGCVSPPSARHAAHPRHGSGDDRGRRSARRLGVVPQADTLDNELTVRENLIIYGRYFGLSRAEVRAARRRAARVRAARRSAQTSKVEPLSGGMKRRLTIARSLVNEPEVLLLDEPTTGLDPQARHVVWDRLFRLKQQGVTLVLTTHYMDEAEQLCDRLVVMDRGTIAEEGSPLELIQRLSTREVVELRFPDEAPEVDPGVVRRPGRPRRGAAGPACSSTPTTATRSSRSRTSGCSRRACSCAAPRSRTSSSGSPGRTLVD